MWHIASVRRHGVSIHRAHSGSGKHHRGFSHPARFETLEQRLALTAPAGGNAQLGTTAQFGTTDLGGFLMEQNGLEPLPGSASELTGNNPAQIALVGVWGTADPSFLRPGYDYLAFNNPSWIPNVRTLTPIPFTNDTDLPMNIYQSVRSPRGIRNFEIGANTSMAHGNASPIGEASTATRPVPVAPKFTQAIEHPLDEGLLSNDAGVEKPEADAWKPPEMASLPTDQQIPSAPQEAKIDEKVELPASGALPSNDVRSVAASVHLDRAAVDQMMGEPEDLQTPLPAALCEPAVEEVALSGRGEEAGLHAVAASLALGATLTLHRPAKGTSLTELVVRAKEEPRPPQEANRGKNRNRR